jgi:periplasmic copper chaperone A
MKLYRRILFTALALLLAACAAPGSTAPKLQVKNARVNPASMMAEATATSDMPGMATETPASSGMEMASMDSGPNSAAYFTIVNDGGVADTLIGASTDVAKSADMHQTKVENNVAQMMPVAKVEIPAHSTLEFKPGGYHLMLMGLTKDLAAGQTVKLTLQFEKSGSITVDATVGVGQ